MTVFHPKLNVADQLKACQAVNSGGNRPEITLVAFQRFEPAKCDRMSYSGRKRTVDLRRVSFVAARGCPREDAVIQPLGPGFMEAIAFGECARNQSPN